MAGNVVLVADQKEYRMMASSHRLHCPESSNATILILYSLTGRYFYPIEAGPQDAEWEIYDDERIVYALHPREIVR